MRTATKATKTLSLDRDILAELKRTKGAGSESERANQLLRFALDRERKAALDREAASFFTTAPQDRTERTAFQATTFVVLSRE